MNKLVIILFLVSNYLFAFTCPYGCLDGSTEPIYTKQGEVNYDINDNKMLQEFIDIADKMQAYYQDFENKSSKMIEDGAKIQYLEDVISSELVLELNKANDLKSLEIDANAIKTNQNSKSLVK